MKASLILLAGLLLAGCADLNTNTFRAEKLFADSAVASVASYNRYFEAATNGASADKIAALTKERDQIWDASRKASAVLAVTEASRLAYSTNATPANEATLRANLSSLSANSGNVTNAVANAMAPYSTVKGLP